MFFRPEKVKIFDILEKCPGGHHTWIISNFGRIRKPYSTIKIEKSITWRLKLAFLGILQKLKPLFSIRINFKRGFIEKRYQGSFYKRKKKK